MHPYILHSLRIFNAIQEFTPNKPTIVTIGTFDGVHLGHMKILEQLCHNAKALDCESLVLTFFPHPRMIIQEDSEMKQLNTLEEKEILLEKIGIDNLVIHPFNREFSRLTAEEFVKTVLVDTFNVKKIIIGYDHRFGRNRTADINDLINFGALYNFDVEQISAKEINEVSISSTKIRKALEEGNLSLAKTFLGYDYFLTGTITQGKQLGRTIGFPTANLKIRESYKLIPQNGVYVVKSTLNNRFVYGMMNIGTNPTVNGTSQSIEIHYFDFDENLYNKNVSVSILKRIRSEQKFDSVESLKNQLHIDQLVAQDFIHTTKE